MATLSRTYLTGLYTHTHTHTHTHTQSLVSLTHTHAHMLIIFTLITAELFKTLRQPTQIHNDQDFFLRVTDADPITEWVDQGDWGADNHCTITGARGVHSIPLPKDWTSASDCDASGCRSAPNQANNNAMGVLLPDNVSIVQMQPA